MIILISDIAVINRQRKTMDSAELRALADDIQARGLLHDIVVRSPYESEREQVGKCSHVLMAGGRRLAAHVLLGRKEISAKLKDDLSPIDARIAELSENIRRANISWQEETEARTEIDSLIKRLNPASTLADRAEVVGISSAQLSKDLSLTKALKADPRLKASTSKGAAIRTAAFHATISERVRNATSSDSNRMEDLRTKLQTADAREFIAKVPSQSIDLVFSDLPYGIDYFDNTKAGRNSEQIHSYYDDGAEPAMKLNGQLIPHFARVVKPSGWIILFMCYEWHKWISNSFLKACANHGEYEAEDAAGSQCTQGKATNTPCRFLTPELVPWIWTRRGKGNHGHWPELHASSRYEMLVVVNGGSAKLAKKPIENVLDFPPMEGERLHAMQKPHELCKEIIERTTVIGEKVLDVTMGSGAHMAAAASLNRDFLGCDSNPDLLDSALSLVSQHWNKTTYDAVQRGKGESK